LEVSVEEKDIGIIKTWGTHSVMRTFNHFRQLLKFKGSNVNVVWKEILEKKYIPGREELSLSPLTLFCFRRLPPVY